MSRSFMLKTLAICVCVAGAGAAAASAQGNLIPQTGERKIAGGLMGDQVHPHAAVTPTNGFVVWQDNSVTRDGTRIRAQLLDGSFNAVGSPVVVSSAWKSKATGDQQKPQVGILPDGGAVIVWQQAGAGKKPTQQQIYARFLSPNGTPLKKDLRIGENLKVHQQDPTLAVLANGTVLVVWSSLNQDGSMLGVFAERLTSSGVKIGAEFQINQFTANNQRDPAVAALADGRSVIAWVSELKPPTANVDICARFLGDSGLPVGNEFTVNLTTSNACANPVVVGSTDGGFAVAWSQKDDVTRFLQGSVQIPEGGELSSRSWDVFARTFNSQGVGASDAVLLNSTTFGDQFAARLSSLNGNLMAVWTSLGQDGSREGVFARSISANGVMGNETRVNTTTFSRQIHPGVFSDGADRFLAIWSSFGPGTSFDLIARVYSQPSGM